MYSIWVSPLSSKVCLHFPYAQQHRWCQAHGMLLHLNPFYHNSKLSFYCSVDPFQLLVLCMLLQGAYRLYRGPSSPTLLNDCAPALILILYLCVFTLNLVWLDITVKLVF